MSSTPKKNSKATKSGHQDPSSGAMASSAIIDPAFLSAAALQDPPTDKAFSTHLRMMALGKDYPFSSLGGFAEGHYTEF